MNAQECREKARQCRAQAEISFGTLKSDFLSAAATWEELADQLERTNLFGGVGPVEGSPHPRR